MSFKFSQHVGIFENAISKEWCDAVIKWYEDMPSNQKFQRKDYWSKDPKAGNRNSAKDLSSSLIELPPDQTELPELNQKLAEHFMSKLSNFWTEYSDKCKFKRQNHRRGIIYGILNYQLFLNLMRIKNNNWRVFPDLLFIPCI